MLLEFQKSIIQEMEGNDLCVIAKGLSLEQILSSLVKIHQSPTHLILLLNLLPPQLEILKNSLQDNEKIQILDSEVPKKSRELLYKSGGVISVTSRILVVDILLKVVPTDRVAGLIIYNAHSIQEFSITAFIVKLYRSSNKLGFIKCFSDQPEPFCAELTKLERTMKMLQVRNLHLWPRFHVTVRADLDKYGVEVIEEKIGLSKKMKTIQASLMECTSQMLLELKRMHSFIDLEQLKLENAFTKAFDFVIRQQLEPVWQKTSAKTKKLVADLKTVRILLKYLLQYDSVSFYSFVETEWQTAMQAKKSFYSEKSSFSWIDLDASSLVLQLARSRVFSKSVGAESSDRNIPKEYKVHLEEQPKWRALIQILTEVQAERRDNFESRGSVLVMVNGGRNTDQVRTIIAKTNLDSQLAQTKEKFTSPGTKKVLMSNVYNYFRWKARMAGISKRIDQEQPVSTIQKPSTSNKRRREHQVEVPAVDLANPSGFKDEARKIAEFISAANPNDTFSEASPNYSEFQAHIYIKSYASYSTDFSYENESSDCNVLDFLQPHWIIMYDPDAAFIRRIEVYKAMNPTANLKVYFMTYDNSFEEQVYLTGLRKEKEAFEKLIMQKSQIAIPIDEQGHVIADPERYFSNALSSRAGGGQETQQLKKVLVDVREFRASLPLLLYSFHIEVIPCTIEVGDYVLSPTICIERKAPSDLAQSLKSGRLFKQAQAMTLHYSKPMLLIEFAQISSFSLSFGQDSEFCTAKRLALLIIHFPKLAVIWSSSPTSTAEIVQDLQQDQPDPDLIKAQSCGLESETKLDKATNQTPMEMLLNLPGISFKNYKIAMRAVKNIRELCELSLVDCIGLIGAENGRKLYDFFHAALGVFS